MAGQLLSPTFPASLQVYSTEVWFPNSFSLSEFVCKKPYVKPHGQWWDGTTAPLTGRGVRVGRAPSQPRLCQSIQHLKAFSSGRLILQRDMGDYSSPRCHPRRGPFISQGWWCCSGSPGAVTTQGWSDPTTCSRVRSCAGSLPLGSSVSIHATSCKHPHLLS